jgi:UDP-glucose 4-epimerase
VAQICVKTPLFIQGDIRDGNLLDRIFAAQSIDAVLHLAGLKAVDESI